MPLRFNQKELTIIATKANSNFEKIGVLLMHESEEKTFYKAESRLSCENILFEKSVRYGDNF